MASNVSYSKARPNKRQYFPCLEGSSQAIERRRRPWFLAHSPCQASRSAWDGHGVMQATSIKRGGRGPDLMDPVIIRVTASVDIAAPPSKVFALVGDAEAKTRLNPFVQVIRVELETPGPLREGSVTYFRLQKGKRIYEHRSRCHRFEPDRLLEGQAVLPVLYRVRVELEPTPAGTRLTQEEECEVTPEMLEGLPVSHRAERAWRFMETLSFFLPKLARETYAVIFRERAESLRLSIQRELRVWLEAIKAQLESGQSPDSSASPATRRVTEAGNA